MSIRIGTLALLASACMSACTSTATIANDDWCMTRHPIPPYHITNTTRVVDVARVTPTSHRQHCAGEMIMHCVMIETRRQPIPRNANAAGATFRQCADTARGRACVSIIAIVAAGTRLPGGVITKRCERDTREHELSHAINGAWH